MPITWSTKDSGNMVFTQFNTAAMTASTLGTIWTPTSGKTFVLMGWSLVAVVTTELVAANAFALVMVDNALATKVGPALGGFAPNASVGTTFVAHGNVPASGWYSGAVDRVLKVATAPATSLGTGVIRLAGMVWGREV